MSGTFQGFQTLQFTPDNKHAYAYSGVMNVAEVETTMVKFSTNSEYLKAKVLFAYPDNTGTDDFRYRIYFNNQVVQSIIQGRVDYDFKFEYAIPLIIPPLTEVKLTVQNVQNTNSRDQCASLTASVHGAIEQFDLRLNNE